MGGINNMNHNKKAADINAFGSYPVTYGEGLDKLPQQQLNQNIKNAPVTKYTDALEWNYIKNNAKTGYDPSKYKYKDKQTGISFNINRKPVVQPADVDTTQIKQQFPTADIVTLYNKAKSGKPVTQADLDTSRNAQVKTIMSAAPNADTMTTQQYDAGASYLKARGAENQKFFEDNKLEADPTTGVKLPDIITDDEVRKYLEHEGKHVSSNDATENKTASMKYTDTINMPEYDKRTTEYEQDKIDTSSVNALASLGTGAGALLLASGLATRSDTQVFIGAPLLAASLVGAYRYHTNRMKGVPRSVKIDNTATAALSSGVGAAAGVAGASLLTALVSYARSK